MKRKFQSITSRLWSAAALVVIIGIWQVAASAGLVPGYMLPSPVEVVQALISDFPLLMEHAKVILSRLVDTFFSRISLTMPPAPKSHNTACVLPQEEPLHWQSRSSGYSSS